MRKCGRESDSPKTLQSTRMRQVVPATGINVANADVFKSSVRADMLGGSTANCTS